MITHESLEAFEERARTGKLRTEVGEDLRVVLALVESARLMRRYFDTREAVGRDGVPVTAAVLAQFRDARVAVQEQLLKVPA